MNIGNLDIGVNLDTGKLTSGIKDATEKTKSFGDSLKNLITIAAAAIAIKKLSDFFIDAGKAAGEQQEAEILLGQAMRNTGTYTREALQASIDYATALQSQSTFTDEAILMAQKSLVAFGAEGEMLKKLTQATLDFASAKGMDLVTASDLVAKSIGSDTNALSRYGIAIEGSARSTDRMQEAVDGISKLYAGSALAATESYLGQIKQLTNTYDELKEAIGVITIKAITPFIILLKNQIIPRLQKWFSDSDNIRRITIVLGSVLSGLMKILASVTGGFDIFATSLKSVGMLIYNIATRNLKGLLDTTLPSIKAITEKTKFWQEALIGIDNVFKDMNTGTLPATTKIIEAMPATFNATTDKITESVKKMSFNSIEEFWKMRNGLLNVTNEMLATIEDKSMGMQNVWERAVESFTANTIGWKELALESFGLIEGALATTLTSMLVDGESFKVTMGKVWDELKRKIIEVCIEIAAEQAVIALINLLQRLFRLSDKATVSRAMQTITTEANQQDLYYNGNDWQSGTSKSEQIKSDEKSKANWQRYVEVVGAGFVDIVKGADNTWKNIDDTWKNIDNTVKDWGNKINDTVSGWTGKVKGWFAEGVTDFQGGLAMVGESGPELVHLPAGSDVFSNDETRNILGSKLSSPGSVSSKTNNQINIVINATVRNDEDWEKVTRNKIIPALQRYQKKTYVSPFA